MSLRSRARELLAGAGPLSAVVGADGTPAAALTWDDGPDQRWTPLLLQVLADAGVRATFFVLLSRARRHPHLVRDAVAAGHEIALHGPDHIDLRHVTPGRLRRRTLDARAELEDLAGRPVVCFRPPYMSIGVLGCLALQGTGLRVVGHDTAVHDWEADRTDEQRVAVWAAGLRPGGITLAHDAWPGPADGVASRPEPSVDRVWLARQMTATAAARGIPLTTVSDLLAGAGGEARTVPVASARVTHLGPYLPHRRRSARPPGTVPGD